MRRSLAVAIIVVFAVVPGGAAALPRSVSIVFTGTYTLTAHASQSSYHPAASDCVPGSMQSEIESISWRIRFAASHLPTRGSVVLAAAKSSVSGRHVWDEASAKCRAFPAGHLVCRTHFVPGNARLLLVLDRGRMTFHPELGQVSISDGCRGQVYNEHPDCGARDAAGITDFAFETTLRGRAPSLAAPAASASFKVSRTKMCASRGKRNWNTIHQRVAAEYRGVFAVSHTVRRVAGDPAVTGERGSR